MSDRGAEPILPHTRVEALLRVHPELEEVLFGLSPAFRKLTNPVLRRTVARVATLATAAKMADIPVGRLVDELRAAIGQPPLSAPADGGGAEGEAEPLEGIIGEILDVDALLDTGEHPLAIVRRHLDALAEGEILRLVSSFRPEPLIEALRNEGHEVRTRPAAGSNWQTDLKPPHARDGL